eukprot:symbB.v1.2.017463.t1/scaffold1361.1/size175804/3
MCRSSGADGDVAPHAEPSGTYSGFKRGCQDRRATDFSEEVEVPVTAKEVLQEAVSDLLRRSGGAGSFSCAVVLGGACGSLLWIPGAPRIEVSGVQLTGWKAPFAGAAFGAYSVQLEGDALSGRYRQLCTWTAQQCQRATEAIKKSAVAQIRFHAMQGRISKHLSLACEGGAVYRLLLQGVSQKDLEIQKDLLTAAYGRQDVSKLHPAATSRILDAVHHHKADLGAVNASTALHLLAQTRQAGEVAKVADLIMSVVAGSAEPRDLAIASWASARLELGQVDGCSEALQALQDAIHVAAFKLEGQDVANVAWAFATLCPQKSKKLLEKLAQESSMKLKEFSPRHLAITTWSLAKVKVRNDDFMLAAVHVLKRSKAENWMPQDLSNFLWASASLRCDVPLPLDVLAARAADLRWQHFKPQELSICMWAAYTLGVVDGRGASILAVKRMLQHAAREIRVNGAKDFEPRHVMNAAWALARWQRHCRLMGWPQECKDYVCRPALRILMAEASKNLDAFRPHELSRLIWAVASQSCLKLREVGPPLRDYTRSPVHLQGFDPDALVSLVTSLSWILERLVWEVPGRRTRSAVGTANMIPIFVAAFFSKLPTQPDLVFARGRREISAMDAAFVGSPGSHSALQVGGNTVQPNLPAHPRPQCDALVPAVASAAAFVATLRMKGRREGKTHMKESNAATQDTSKYSKLVQEDRMITIEESNLRYAGAALILLVGIYKYVGMCSAGVFNYSTIAADAAGAWAVFETGRQSL